MRYTIEYEQNGETKSMTVDANSLESATRFVNERTKVRFDGYTPKSKEPELVTEVTEEELLDELELEDDMLDEDEE